MWLTKRHIEKSLEKIVENALQKASRTFSLAENALALQQEIETLKIEKGRREEEFQKREREVEHKIGLERTRQEKSGMSNFGATLANSMRSE